LSSDDLGCFPKCFSKVVLSLIKCFSSSANLFSILVFNCSTSCYFFWIVFSLTNILDLRSFTYFSNFFVNDYPEMWSYLSECFKNSICYSNFIIYYSYFKLISLWLLNSFSSLAFSNTSPLSSYFWVCYNWRMSVYITLSALSSKGPVKPCIGSSIKSILSILIFKSKSLTLFHFSCELGASNYGLNKGLLISIVSD
jgi:hypothetical protein